MEDTTIWLAWKRSHTPELDTLCDELSEHAYDHGYELDTSALSRISLLAFKAGYEAGRDHDRAAA